MGLQVNPKAVVCHPAFLISVTAITSGVCGFFAGKYFAENKKEEVQPLKLVKNENQLAFDFDEGKVVYFDEHWVKEPLDDTMAIHPSNYEPDVTEEEADRIEKMIGVYDPSDNLQHMNVFTENVDVDEDDYIKPSSVIGEWDYTIEYNKRTLSKPYQIHEDEYHGMESGYTQAALLYYVDDKTVADENEVAVPDYKRLLGDFTFGHGSSAADMCFIRNPALEMEWEIIRVDGRYAEAVLGLDLETENESQDLKHSHRPLKFRTDM